MRTRVHIFAQQTTARNTPYGSKPKNILVILDGCPLHFSILLACQKHTTPYNNTCSTHSRQVLLCAKSHQPLTSGQRPLLFGVRRDLMRVTGGNCTLPTIRIWKTTPLPVPSQCLVHTNPRADAPATSPNSAAPLDTPHSALTAGVDTPQPTALGNCQLRVSRA